MKLSTKLVDMSSYSSKGNSPQAIAPSTTSQSGEKRSRSDDNGQSSGELPTMCNQAQAQQNWIPAVEDMANLLATEFDSCLTGLRGEEADANFDLRSALEALEQESTANAQITSYSPKMSHKSDRNDG